MPNESSKSEPTFGYLTVVHSASHGFFGGYLIVSQLGRPLEFHCTSPVRPSRAQEILYGPTLQPYLVGEQISGSLLAAAKLTPQLILTDQPATCEARRRIEVPIVCLLCPSTGSSDTVEWTGTSHEGERAASKVKSARHTTSLASKFMFCDYEFSLPPGFESDRAIVQQNLALLTPHVDLAEPFGRIHEAICEVQRIGAVTAERHHHAA